MMIECRPQTYYQKTRKVKMPAEILIGCAGYSYNDWSGIFYPPEIPSTKRL